MSVPIQTTPPLLEVTELGHSFQGLRALDEVSFSLRPGEVVGLIGPNGSGKTTLLNVITGIYHQQDGSIRFRGRDIKTVKRHDRVAAGISRTFQEPRCFESLQLLAHPIVASCTVETKGFWQHFLSSWRNHTERGRKFLQEVGLTVGGERLAASMPYGRRRVLELARCLGTSPSLLFLDEPTAGLNSRESKEFGELLAGLVRSRHTSLVVVDHDMDFILGLCPRLLVLERGRLLFDGTKEAALRAPQVIEAYFGAEPC